MKIPVIYAGLKERKREMMKKSVAPKKPMVKMAKGGAVKKPVKKYNVGGQIPDTRQDPANSNIMPKNNVVGSMSKEQQIEGQKAELAKYAGPTPSYMPSAGMSPSNPQQKTSINQQQQYDLMKSGALDQQLKSQEAAARNAAAASNAATRAPKPMRQRVPAPPPPQRRIPAPKVRAMPQQMMAKGGVVKKGKKK